MALQGGRYKTDLKNIRRRASRHRQGVEPRRLRDSDGANTRCPSCGTVKPNDEFNRDASRWDGLTYACRSCIAEARKLRNAPDPGAVRTRHRKNQLQRYDLTPGQYDQMYQQQAGACFICEAPVDRLHVDHDHATGKVRGLLCQNCNHGLGNFKDRVDFILRAADYLLAQQNVLQRIGAEL